MGETRNRVELQASDAIKASSSISLLAPIIHRHPPIRPNGVFTQQVTFPKPGPYRVVLDVYPATGAQPNFQLIDDPQGAPLLIHVAVAADLACRDFNPTAPCRSYALSTITTPANRNK